MKDIVDLKVTQIRLYPIDVLPIAALLVEKNLAPFKDTLRFKTASGGEAKPEAVAFELLGGEFDYQGSTHLIERLTIEPRRLIFVTLGPSTVANALYDEIRKILIAADPERRLEKREPYVKVEETSCVITLEVDFRQLFAPRLLQFLEKNVQPRTSNGSATSTVLLSRFSARVSYDLTDPNLKKVGVRLVDKVVTIEPRSGTGLDEKRYFTQSPTDSETHLALLREFEKAFGSTTD